VSKNEDGHVRRVAIEDSNRGWIGVFSIVLYVLVHCVSEGITIYYYRLFFRLTF
jgi:hypothetical protein